jgi:hypothetical protein
MTTKKVAETDIPEVMHFLAVKKQIDDLKEGYPEVFERLRQLQQDYNQALEAAEKAVRGRQVSCGPFHLYQWQTSLDAEKLYEELGRDEFLKVGGKIQTVTTYDLDKNKFEAHVTAGTIPKEVVDVVKKVSPRYKKPEKINV